MDSLGTSSWCRRRGLTVSTVVGEPIPLWPVAWTRRADSTAMGVDANSPDAVADVLRDLAEDGIVAAVFGGWAEEALGLIDPGPHRDIDLLVFSDSFADIDATFTTGQRPHEIMEKRFHHKRAFRFRGVVVELILVERRGGRSVTRFWADTEHIWHEPLTTVARLGVHTLRVVSASNLSDFRERYQAHEPWRWRDPASLVPPARVC